MTKISKSDVENNEAFHQNGARARHQKHQNAARDKYGDYLASNSGCNPLTRA